MKGSIAWVVASTLACRLIMLSATAVEPLQIVSQPQSQMAPVGGRAAFSVTVSGDDPNYEWWFNGAPIPGATNSVYTVDNVQSTNAGNYAVGVFNDAVWIASSVVTLRVVSQPTISVISDQTTDENQPLGPLDVSIEGWSAPLGTPTLTASSSNTNLVPNENLLFDGTGTNSTVTILPATNQFGLCYITINVTGANGAFASTTFAVNVNHVNLPPQFVGDPPIIAQPYQLYSYTLQVSDPDPGARLHVSAVTLPSWLSFNRDTLVLSGTPPRGGPEGDAVVLELSDEIAPPVRKSFRIWTADPIDIANADELEAKRQSLIQFIWGADGWPTNRAPAEIQTNFTNSVYDSLYNEEGNLSRIDLYVVKMAYDLKSRVYHFHPIRSNGRLFIYHAGHNWHGFIGDDVDHNNQHVNPGLVIATLLKEGFSVLAFDMPVFNGYEPPHVSVPWTTEILTLTSHGDIFSFLEKPYRFFFEPVVVALNFVQDAYGYRSIYMTGFSGGGWMSSVYPAMDRRIDRSYAVAGSAPNYLRIGYEGLGDAEQDNSGFCRIANYKEFYVMSAYGPNRLQLQILNRYDACCFYGTRFTNWVDEVKSKVGQLGTGRYNFYSDTTHHEHKISTNALAVILNSFPPTIDEISNLTMLMNAGPRTVGLAGIGPASPARTAGLSVSAVSDNPELTGALAVSYSNPDSSGSLSFTPQTDVGGVARILVTVKDAISDDALYTRAFTVTVNPPGIPPVVQWVGPTDRTTVEPMQPVTLQAAASDADGTIVQVEFRDGTNSLGVVSSAPYSLLWSNPTVGTHTLSAVATDDRGNVSTSETALLTVLPVNQAPLVQWLNPTTETILQKPQPVTLQAAASDLDGTIVQVEFRDGTNSLGVVSSAPYSLLWSNPTVGTHTLSAVATDDRGGATTSGPAVLTVLPPNQVPLVQWVSPSNPSILQKPEPVTLQAVASDLDGTIARVEFRDGTTTLGVVSSAPYNLLWSNPTVGTHSLSAVATDDRGGVATSDAALLTVLPLNQVPLVQWVSPSNQSILQKPEPVTLQANVSDVDGTIARVEFRDGTNILGGVSSPPYSLLWNNPTVGTHTLSAVATDNRGGASSSETALLTVLPLNQAPLVQWVSPSNPSILQKPEPVTLQAAASDLDGTIVRVEFRDGTNTLGVVSGAPYHLLWSSPTVGTHTLSAVATDDRGGVTASDTALLTVLPLNQLPLVQWRSPTDGLTLEGPNAVTLEVLASDPDGTVVQVEYRDGTNSLAVVTNGQYFSLTRDHLGPGTHVLSATATDNRGGSTETPPVTITIAPANQAPTVQWLAPTNGAVFEASETIVLQASAADPDGNLARVEFLDGTNSLGVVSSPPYSLLWSNPTVGTHTLSAVAIDDRGATASELITVTVAATNNVPLTIQSMDFVPVQGQPVTRSALDPADSQFQLQIGGPAGRVVVVEASNDFSNWAPISTNTLVNGAAVSADADSRNFSIRFYRVRLATQAP